MDTNITFNKQNISFIPEPNIAVPKVNVYNNSIILSFLTDVPNIEGRIIFNEALMYRVGDPNDEGFFDLNSSSKIKNNSIYSFTKFPDLEFNAFYVVNGFDWKNYLLGEDTHILDEKYKNINGYTHFVFFMKDSTFECIAESYKVL